MLSEKQLLNAPESDYMSPLQLAFFRNRLLKMRRDILLHLQTHQEQLSHSEAFADECDQASENSARWNALTINSRENDKLRDIEAALERIAKGNYGYCEETCDPIGLRRLLAYPIATHSLEAMARREHRYAVGHTSLRPIMYGV